MKPLLHLEVMCVLPCKIRGLHAVLEKVSWDIEELLLVLNKGCRLLQF